MLNPSLADLLRGVADALHRDVLGELPPGPARDQVLSAIGITRRVARALPQLTPYLQQDSQDLAATLRRLPGPADDEGLASALATVDGLPLSPLPGLDALGAANLVLREAVARTAEDPALDQEDDARLRALLGRMQAREAALRLSPWER